MKKITVYAIKVGVVLALFIFSAYAGSAVEAAGPSVVVYVPMEGVVGVTMEQYLDEAFTYAAVTKASIMVIGIDTPGGLVTSMRGMSQKILAAPIPVAVWVGPSGARAASAGAFLVMSAHIAAMAPGTNIGAAHPVTASGQDVPDKEMNRKVTNDLAAQMRSLAEERGRNAEVAASMVVESVSLTAGEAVGKKVVDTVAPDVPSLVRWADGREVRIGGNRVNLDLKQFEIRRFQMNPRLKVLHFISRPDVAYMMLTMGILAIVLEVMSPGGFVLGVSGAVMALMGAYGLRMLPFNWAGVILLVAGIVVLVLDLVVGGMGILSLFGLGSLVMGALVIFKAPGGELLNVSVGFLVGMVLTLGVFFLLAAGAVWRSTRKRVASGREGMLQVEGVVVEELSPEGFVSCHGEIWKAVSDTGENIPSGTRVRVVKSEGLSLRVREIGNIDFSAKGENQK